MSGLTYCDGFLPVCPNLKCEYWNGSSKVYASNPFSGFVSDYFWEPIAATPGNILVGANSTRPFGLTIEQACELYWRVKKLQWNLSADLSITAPLITSNSELWDSGIGAWIPKTATADGGEINLKNVLPGLIVASSSASGMSHFVCGDRLLSAEFLGGIPTGSPGDGRTDATPLPFFEINATAYAYSKAETSGTILWAPSVYFYFFDGLYWPNVAPTYYANYNATVLKSWRKSTGPASSDYTDHDASFTDTRFVSLGGKYLFFEIVDYDSSATNTDGATITLTLESGNVSGKMITWTGVNRKTLTGAPTSMGSEIPSIGWPSFDSEIEATDWYT